MEGFFAQRNAGGMALLQGIHAAQWGDNIPGHIKARCERIGTREEGLLAQLQEVKTSYYLANGHEIPPSRLRHELEEIMYRDVFGVAPADLVAGFITGGPNKGRKIKGFGGRVALGEGMTLCAEIEDAGDKTLFVGNVQNPAEFAAREKSYALAGGINTPQGNTATDRALIYSWWDTGLYGGTAYLFAPPVLEQMLTIRAREVGWMRPFLNMGIAPSLSYQIKTRTNNAVQQLFTSASSYSILNSGVVPVKEGRVGSTFMRPKYGSADMGVRGYHLLTDITAEAMMSIEARRTGAWQSALEDLMKGLGYIDEYDMVLALFYGLTTGYSRQRKASDDSWDVATLEVPRGKASFIGTSFKNHALFYAYKTGKILLPVSHATDFFKVSAAAVLDEGLYQATGNEIIELCVAMQHRLAKKHRKCEVISLPFSMQVKLGLDTRVGDKMKVFGEADVRFKNEPGFMGTVVHPAIGRVTLLAQPEGSTPSDLATADSVAIEGIIIAGETGQAVTEHVYMPSSIELAEGMEIVTNDSVAQAYKNGKTVASARGAAGVQPLDLDSVEVAFVIGQ